jgi:molybdopterin-guanine dinucleotide biosynthesis protein A
VHVDLQPGSGPLGAVLTGLEVSPRGLGLFLAVDLPNVPVELLAFLLARSEGWDAVVPVHRRGEEPLCAVYASSCLAPVRRRLAAGDFKMTSFWPEVRVRTVTEAEIGAFGDPDHLCRNLNGPGDLEDSD